MKYKRLVEYGGLYENYLNYMKSQYYEQILYSQKHSMNITIQYPVTKNQDEAEKSNRDLAKKVFYKLIF